MVEFAELPHGEVEVTAAEEIWRRAVRSDDHIDDGEVSPDAFNLSGADKKAGGKLSGRLASLISLEEVFEDDTAAIALCELTVADIEAVPDPRTRLLRCVDDSALPESPRGHGYVDHSKLRPFRSSASAKEVREDVRIGLATRASARGLAYRPVAAADEASLLDAASSQA